MAEQQGIEAFDLASLESFVADLVAHGFEPVKGCGRRVWRGRIHPAFAALTTASTMQVVLLDGWPYKPPAVVVQGLAANHSTLNGLVCMWRDDDASGRWMTVDGLFERIAEWCHEAEHGWEPRDLGHDARLNIRRKLRCLAIFDFESLGIRPGGWGDLHAIPTADPITVTLGPGRGTGRAIKGLWFHVGELTLPPRDFSELRRCLPRNQWRQLLVAVGKRPRTEPFAGGDGVDLVVISWTRNETTDLLVLAIEGSGETAEVIAMQPAPNDEATLLLRAGPDASLLRHKSVAVFGAGALGGHIAVALAESGVGSLHVVDSEVLTPANVVRHVAGRGHVGHAKVKAVEDIVADHAPWTQVTCHDEAPSTPSEITVIVQGADLVLDATGNAAVTSAIEVTAKSLGKPFTSAALYRGGKVGRIRRVAQPEDVAFLDRVGPRYPVIPRAQDEEEDLLTPNLGCSAPVNNAPPAAVAACSGLAAQVAIDAIIGRFDFSDELIQVFRPLAGEPPFDRIGTLTPT